MRFPQQRWPTVAVALPSRTTSMGHRCVSAGVSSGRLLSAVRAGTCRRSAQAQVSRHSGHSAQPAAGSPEAGALYLGKNEGEVPPPPDQDLRDPPHSQKKLTLAHRWLFGRGGQPQPWAIDAAATASMGHRCGSSARLSSIDGPPMRLQPEPDRCGKPAQPASNDVLAKRDRLWSQPRIRF